MLRESLASVRQLLRLPKRATYSIRMDFQRLLTIGFLNFCLSGCWLDLQQLIRVDVLIVGHLVVRSGEGACRKTCQSKSQHGRGRLCYGTQVPTPNPFNLNTSSLLRSTPPCNVATLDYILYTQEGLCIFGGEGHEGGTNKLLRLLRSNRRRPSPSLLFTR